MDNTSLVQYSVGIIDTVDIATRTVHVKDKHGGRFMVSMFGSDNALLIPALNETWFIVSIDRSWYLWKRFDQGDETTLFESMVEGDARLRAKHKLYLDAEEFYYNGVEGPKYVTAELSATDLHTIFTNPVQILPAPGVGRIHVPLSFVLSYTFGTHAFSCNFAAANQEGYLFVYDDSGYGFNTETCQSVGPINLSLISMFMPFTKLAPAANAITLGDNKPLFFAGNYIDYNQGAMETLTVATPGSCYHVGDRIAPVNVGGVGGVVIIDSVDGSGGVLAAHADPGGLGYAVRSNVDSNSLDDSYPVIGANNGTDTFTFAGDLVSKMAAPRKLNIDASTGGLNDRLWTVVSATLNAGNTDVVVTPHGAINPVADGYATPEGITFQHNVTSILLGDGSAKIHVTYQTITI